MPQGRLILDVGILASTVPALAVMFYVGIFLGLVPWLVRAILLGSGAPVVWILLWITPVRYSLEGGVVRLCSPLRCVEYEVVEVEGARFTTLACGESGFSVAASAGLRWRGLGAPTANSTSPLRSAETHGKSYKSAKAARGTPCGYVLTAAVKVRLLTDLASIFAQ